ncbi:MAG: hypothetical protein ACPLXL_00885 [Minisyncoccia bacterium]
MFLLKIIPIIRLPFQENYYFYYSSEDLKKGSIVEINFKNRNCFGLVSESAPVLKFKNLIKKVPYRLKKINKIVIDFPLFNTPLFLLANFLSQYYYCSLPLAIKTILPSNLKSFFNFLKKEQIDLNRLEDPKELSEIVITETRDFSLITKKISAYSSHYQVLFLTPTNFHVSYYQEKLPNSVIFQKKSKKENFKIFKEILEKKPFLILGTRSAVFLPFQNLKLVIVSDPENQSYKSWDQKPFYQAIRIAQKLAFYHQAELIFYYD